jgi:hypothetical protein
MTGWTWASTKTQVISYDGNGQISAYNLGIRRLPVFAAPFFATARGASLATPMSSNGTPVPALDQSFGYDNLNRLISATLGLRRFNTAMTPRATARPR